MNNITSDRGLYLIKALISLFGNLLKLRLQYKRLESAVLCRAVK